MHGLIEDCFSSFIFAVDVLASGMYAMRHSQWVCIHEHMRSFFLLQVMSGFEKVLSLAMMKSYQSPW